MNRVTQNSAAVADFGRGYGWRLITQTWRPQGDGAPRHGAGKVSSYKLPRPPRITRDEARAQLSPVQMSFMSESRRLRNDRLKRELRLRLHHPTVQHGLQA